MKIALINVYTRQEEYPCKYSLATMRLSEYLMSFGYKVDLIPISIEKFKKMGRRYWYMIFSLTDETYSVLCSVKVPSEMDEKRVLFLIALLDHIYWITGSVIGALIGEKIPFNSQGIDFAMTALFIVIFLEQWKESKTHIPALTGILISVLFLKLMGPASFLMPALIMIVLILLMGKSLIIREFGCEDVPTNEHVQQEHSQEEGI